MCDLTVTSLTLTPATATSQGCVYLTYTTTSTSQVRWEVMGPEPRGVNYFPAGNYGASLLYLASGAYTYRLFLVDAPDCAATGEFTIVAPPAPVPGCTDAAATNYDAAATADNGSCLYTPPAPVPAYFAVPLLQTLRFVVRGGPFETLDNVLFCEQTRPGQQLRPYYFQLVQAGDQVRVQVLTSYAQVQATITRHGGSQVGPAIALQQVLQLEGPAAPLPVTLTRNPTTETTRLVATAGGSLPASLLGAARLTLAGGATGTYRVSQAVPGSLLSTDDYLVLNRPWADVSGAVTASWQLSGPGFNVFEADLPLDALAAGTYQVQLRATRSGWADAQAVSEPVRVQAQHPGTVLVAYRNADNCFGMVFSTGITPWQRVRGTFFRSTNGGSESTYRGSDKKLVVLESDAQRLRQLETYGLPAYQHEKLFLACRLDYLLVGGVRCQTDQAYEVSELRPYPLTGGRVVLEQTQWLGAGNGDDFGVDETAPENALQLTQGGYLLLRGK